MSLQFVIICETCDRKTPICKGPCPCMEDGINIIDHAKRRQCPLGKFDGVSFEGMPPASIALPRDQWPDLIKEFATQSIPADTGVGDTMHRLMTDAEREKFKAVYAAMFGTGCGCGQGRREDFNALYPY